MDDPHRSLPPMLSRNAVVGDPFPDWLARAHAALGQLLPLVVATGVLLAFEVGVLVIPAAGAWEDLVFGLAAVAARIPGALLFFATASWHGKRHQEQYVRTWLQDCGRDCVQLHLSWTISGWILLILWVVGGGTDEDSLLAGCVGLPALALFMLWAVMVVLVSIIHGFQGWCGGRIEPLASFRRFRI